VLFGPIGIEAPVEHAAFEDVDGDGDEDVILHFRTQAIGLGCEPDPVSLRLVGETVDGARIEAFDYVLTVGCE